MSIDLSPDRASGSDLLTELGIPGGAYEAADQAFDDLSAVAQGDELYAALVAAAPHIRAAELELHIALLTSIMVDVPLIGEKNSGLREGLDFVVQLLLNRKKQLLR